MTITRIDTPTADKQLVNQLAQMSPTALKLIAQTARQAGRPIVVKTWFAEIDGQACGCLMMDGFAGQRKRGLAEFLAKAYAMTRPRYDGTGEYADTTTITETAFYFDQWATAAGHRTRVTVGRSGNKQRHGYIRVLTPAGRREVQKLIREAQSRQKENAAA